MLPASRGCDWQAHTRSSTSTRTSAAVIVTSHVQVQTFADEATTQAENLTQRVTLSYQGEVFPASTGPATDALDIAVPDPQLWWPNGMGLQPLYDVQVELVGADGRVLDSHSERIGLRDLQLIREDDEFGESMRFRVNGRDIFAKGANWIPCDVFIPRIADKTYTHLIESTAESGMNMIRVWGGGFYEQDIFYNLCDEAGILIWQDFMFACATYPTFRSEFMENVPKPLVTFAVCVIILHCLVVVTTNLSRALSPTSGRTAMSWEDYLPLFDDIAKCYCDRAPGCGVLAKQLAYSRRKPSELL